MIDLSIVQINIILCLIDDTLDVKMISLDKFCPQIKHFMPLVVFQEVLQLFERSAKIAKTSLVFHEVSFESMMDFKEQTLLLAEEQKEFKLPEFLHGDSYRLKQVLVNLIKAAIKFSYCKPISIYASYETAKEMLHVFVVDKGKGIKRA